MPTAGESSFAAQVYEMSVIVNEFAQRLRLLRLSPLPGASRICTTHRQRHFFALSPEGPCVDIRSRDPTNVNSRELRGADRLTVAGAACFSTKAKRYEDIPKRVYQSAPKRKHGKYAGMRKWSSPDTGKQEIDSQELNEGQEEDGEMLALGAEGSAQTGSEGREISTSLKEIRVSPWTLNLLTKLVRGLPVVEATAQLKFCKKKHTVTVLKAMQVFLSYMIAQKRSSIETLQHPVVSVDGTRLSMIQQSQVLQAL